MMMAHYLLGVEAALTLILFPYLVSPATDIDKSHVINLNQKIHATLQPTAWYSPSRRFAFGFFSLEHQQNEFLVGIWLLDDDDNAQNNIIVWTANRDNNPVPAFSNSTIELTDAGLILTNPDGETTLIDESSVDYGLINDTGNFVLYDINSKAVWESFDSPTDTILGSQKLAADTQLVSRASPTNFSTGRFRLKMQSDGNLVAYPLNADDGADAYWASNTNNYWSARSDHYINNFYYLHLDTDGTLKLETQFNSSVFMTLNGSYAVDAGGATIYRATLDPDGNFQTYYNTSTEAFWKALTDSCQVKSFCGFNSYCTVNDLIPTCNCVPGTVNNGQFYDGCLRNFTKQRCRDGRADISSYNITTEQKLKWEDEPYFVGLMSEEDCSRSCLQDCDCDAAEYDSNHCNKHKFPLRYVSRDGQKNSKTFFKFGTNNMDHNGRDILPTSPVPDGVRTIKKTNWMMILILASGLVAYSVVSLALFGLFLFKSRVLEYKRLAESGIAKELTLRLYSYKELKVATKGFKEELGKGSFGAVFKGAINNGEKLIAVKRLQKLVEEGEREFQSEMRVIGRTHHKNLVRLLGYCTEGSNRLLVYEFMSNGSLADLLFQSGRRPDWHDRARIALDVARGILYLHEECEAPIIHCDIKPQNILMDEFWNAKISDFGLAKLLMPDQTRTFTDTRGTRGYLAPEWHKNMPISLKVDVYSYGIVLLEIISCRKSIDLSVSKPEEIQLSGWAYSCFAAGETSKLLKGEEVDRRSLERMVSVALWCIQGDPIHRPSMKGVVLMLQGLTTISTPPCPTA